jgi:hypothetical protein
MVGMEMDTYQHSGTVHELSFKNSEVEKATGIG